MREKEFSFFRGQKRKANKLNELIIKSLMGVFTISFVSIFILAKDINNITFKIKSSIYNSSLTSYNSSVMLSESEELEKSLQKYMSDNKIEIKDKNISESILVSIKNSVTKDKENYVSNILKKRKALDTTRLFSEKVLFREFNIQNIDKYAYLWLNSEYLKDGKKLSNKEFIETYIKERNLYVDGKKSLFDKLVNDVELFNIS